ncbi:putative E3 ubiquitin-protein ligase LIN isoform X1 [Vigna radiata var. radiata]|uniref:E3 ubiquitin-protein ligase LIN isoform X1 n=1 Tax=Vigna radiata var. radiata TaxID=3916 RepID=A0A1S3VLP3_VIGRR|nr:putative E3 ubiquitin-protein ligase LIN isoform X1 [Vigna radiata var. radiata]
MAAFGEYSAQCPTPERPKHKLSQHEKKPLPAYICHDPKGLSSPKHKVEKISSKSLSSSPQHKRGGSASERSNSNSLVSADSRRVGPLMDEVAIGAVIAVLSGYIGRYVKDDIFRKTIREKCCSLLDRRRRKDAGHEVFVNMELGMKKIDRLVESQGTMEQVRMIKRLRSSIELLSVVATLNSKTSRDASTCGVPNSHLSACAQLYLAVAYKLQKNDRVSSKHLLQVFCDSPSFARTYLLPDLWEHLFLPHLLHVKIWYNTGLEFLSNEAQGEKERKMKVHNKIYNEKIDRGTILFAQYYKQWLKVGASEPPLPNVSLPSRPSYRLSRSSDSFVSNSSVNQNLFKTVFGSKLEQQPFSLGDPNGVLRITTGLEIDEKLYEDEYKSSSVQKDDRVFVGRSSQFGKNEAQLWPTSQRLDYFQCLSCRFIPKESFENSNRRHKNASAVLSRNFVGAITTIGSSDILSDCEFAIRVITKAWLNSPGDPLIQEALTQPSVVQAMLEVLFSSTNDEILELIISILAELIGRNGAIKQIILNSDPQLEIFVRLLRSTSLFLKAAVLLYLSQPKAKQMLSSEWVPLILRVLEFGDKLQTLFTVQCSPQEAAFYVLDQLLTGFDEDKNLENARQVLSLGGLTLLMARIEGEVHERNNAVMIISCCIRAEGSCRNFLADNINKTSLLELIVVGSKQNSSSYALSVLAELLCLEKRTKTLNFLRGLKDGWGGINVMHVFFIYLEKAPPEERPIVAVILLLLDLMEDPFKGSLYRSEAIQALVAALNCQTCNDRVQQQSARALYLLGGHFSHSGEPLMENSLLEKAGFREICFQDSYPGKENVVYDSIHKNVEEEEEAESWQKRKALVLFNNGYKNLLSALADTIANGIPCLARAGLITISWMSSFLNLIDDRMLPPMVFSILRPQLLQSLDYDKDVEERVLASYSLLYLVKYSGCVSDLPSLDKDSLTHLRNLSLVTWTANELIAIFSKTSLPLRR